MSREVSGQGVSGQGVSAQGECLPDTPSVNRITDACETITLPQTTLWTVIMLVHAEIIKLKPKLGLFIADQHVQCLLKNVSFISKKNRRFVVM